MAEVRSIFAYDLHGHDAGGPLDYQRFFSELANLPLQVRRIKLPRTGQIVAIPEIRPQGSVFAIRFVAGREGELPLFYDPDTGAEREAPARRGEVAVQASWLVIDTRTRLTIQERRRPGVPLDFAARALSGIGREFGLAPNPTLAFTPLVGESFIAEVGSLTQIKSADMILTRPNMSWRDSANSLIAEAAAESNAGSISLGARARPKESLEQDSGIVAEIKEMVGEAFSALKSARVVGRRQGDRKDRTVSTRKHARREDIEVPDAATRADESELVLTGSRRYLRRLARERQAAPDLDEIDDE